MYIQVGNEKLIAYAGYSFMGYTDEVKEVEYEDYQANPNKYMLAVESEEEIEVIDYKTIIVEEQIPIYDENGEITGYETVEVEKQVENGSHTEIKIHYTLVLNPDFEKEQEQKEKERISQLNMTRGDFIEGLILAQGKDEKDIIALIEALTINEIEKKVYINRVNNALDFYRGYPVIDVLCGFLNVPLENMDKFFETKDYTYLKPVVDEIADGEDVNNL